MPRSARDGALPVAGDLGEQQSHSSRRGERKEGNGEAQHFKEEHRGAPNNRKELRPGANGEMTLTMNAASASSHRATATVDWLWHVIPGTT